ncbi:MAG: prephenate dehydrogenase [Granulosicoccus sp.]
MIKGSSSVSGHLCIVGLGLIGGSLAAALKAADASLEISALVRSEKTGELGLQLGLIDRYSLDAGQLIPWADMIMLAVPMLSMRRQLEMIREYANEEAVITDAGSVKQPFIEDARSVFGSLERIVPGHPIAGSERTGVIAADASLFKDRRVLLTPVEETSPAAVAEVTQLWELAGAEVESLTPEHHDRVLAATSHLPHVMAFALVDTLATQQEVEEIFRYAAGGFRDFSRIASSDAIMWRDICLTNKEPLLRMIDSMDEHIKVVRQAIEAGDAELLESTFTRAKNARDRYAQ